MGYGCFIKFVIAMFSMTLPDPPSDICWMGPNSTRVGDAYFLFAGTWPGRSHPESCAAKSVIFTSLGQVFCYSTTWSLFQIMLVPDSGYGLRVLHQVRHRRVFHDATRATQRNLLDGAELDEGRRCVSFSSRSHAGDVTSRTARCESHPLHLNKAGVLLFNQVANVKIRHTENATSLVILSVQRCGGRFYTERIRSNINIRAHAFQIMLKRSW